MLALVLHCGGLDLRWSNRLALVEQRRAALSWARHRSPWCSVVPRWCRAAKSTRPATSSTICRSVSGPGYWRSSSAPIRVRTSRPRRGCCDTSPAVSTIVHPCAAASVREGLEETVTVLTLGLFAASPALAGHDQRRREPHQQDPPRQTQREALPRRPDDAALGRRRRPRSGQGVPAPEGTC